MSIPQTFDAVRKSLARRWGAFEAARSRHTVLADYETPASLALALRPGAALSGRARERMIAALVEENHLAPQPLWQSLLLVAFEPLLLKLRKKLGTPRDEDADQRVFEAFLVTVRAVRAGVYTTLGIAWGTEARLTSREELEVERVEYNDEIQPAAPFGAPADRKLEVSQLLDAIEAEHGRDVVLAIVAMEIGGETLPEYVDRVHPNASCEERARIHGRLGDARESALRSLREAREAARERAA
jgi:hypothetical protein